MKRLKPHHQAALRKAGGERVVRTPAGAKRYGVPEGTPFSQIPQRKQAAPHRAAASVPVGHKPGAAPAPATPKSSSSTPAPKKSAAPANDNPPPKAPKEPAPPWDGPPIAEPNPGALELAGMAWMDHEFYDQVDRHRAAGRAAQEHGYAGFDGDDDDLYDEFQDNPNEAVAGQIIAAAVHSEPTTFPLYRGMRLTDEDLAQYTPGASISMGMSSFAGDRELAKDFANDPTQDGWLAANMPKGASNPVVIVAAPGSRFAPLPGQMGPFPDPDNPDREVLRMPKGGELEHVGFGQFEVEHVSDIDGVRVIAMRQTSMREAGHDGSPQTGEIDPSEPQNRYEQDYLDDMKNILTEAEDEDHARRMAYSDAESYIDDESRRAPMAERALADFDGPYAAPNDWPGPEFPEPTFAQQDLAMEEWQSQDFYSSSRLYREVGRKMQKNGWDPDDRSQQGQAHQVVGALMGLAAQGRNRIEIHRGMRLSRSDADAYVPGAEFSMGMSSFSEYEPDAEGFAKDPSLGGHNQIEVHGSVPVVLTVAPGAFSAPLDGEHVAWGQYIVRSVENKNGMVKVHIEQTTPLEAQ